MAERLGKKDDAARLAEKAGRIRAAYYRAFFNPKTGLLAGWKSKDGKQHDYGFAFVQGLAVYYGLVDAKQGNAIMDHLLAKMRQVGYDCFRYGLPGNLVAVRQEDYVTKDHHAGGSVSPDGSDGFQIYENGGARRATLTGRSGRCINWAARRTLAASSTRCWRAMPRAIFKVRAANGHSKDWRTWKGECWGYEGLLVDCYLPLLAVFDDAAGR